MSAAPVAIIAGTGGAGTAVALALSAAGHHVVLLDSRLEAAEAARATVEAAGGSAEAHGIDLLDREGDDRRPLWKTRELLCACIAQGRKAWAGDYLRIW